MGDLDLDWKLRGQTSDIFCDREIENLWNLLVMGPQGQKSPLVWGSQALGNITVTS